MNEATYTVRVDLRTQYQSMNPDREVVGVLGSCVELGGWRPDRAVIATPSVRHHWDLRVHLPAYCTITWKWVIVNKASGLVKVCEEREGRQLHLKGSGVFIYSLWNGRDRVHMPIHSLPPARQSPTVTQAGLRPRITMDNNSGLATESIMSFPYTNVGKMMRSPSKSFSSEEIAFPSSPKKVSFPEKIVTAVTLYSDSEEWDVKSPTPVHRHIVGGILKKPKMKPNSPRGVFQARTSKDLDRMIAGEDLNNSPTDVASPTSDGCSPVDLSRIQQADNGRNIKSEISSGIIEHQERLCWSDPNPHESSVDPPWWKRKPKDINMWGIDTNVDTGQPDNFRTFDASATDSFRTFAQSVAIGAAVFMFLKQTL